MAARRPTLQELCDELAALTLDELDALAVLALIDSPQTAAEWAKWAKTCGISTTAKRLRSLAERGEQRDLVRLVGDGPKPRYRLPINVGPHLLTALHEHGRLMPRFRLLEQATVQHPNTPRERHVWEPWSYDNQERLGFIFGRLRVGLVLAVDDPNNRMLERALEHLRRFSYRLDREKLLFHAFGVEPPPGWIEALPDPVQREYTNGLLNVCWLTLEAPEPRLARWIADAKDRLLSLELARLLALRGELDAALALPKLPKWSRGALELLERFFAGDYEGAAAIGDATAAAMKQRKYKQLTEIEGLIHALVRIVTMAGDPTRTVVLRESLSNPGRGKDRFAPLYYSLARFEAASRSPTPLERPPRELRLRGNLPLTWPELLVHLCCLHWLGFPLEDQHPEGLRMLSFYRQRAEHGGYLGLARELAALTALVAGDEPSTPSLACAYQRREPWEAVIETLEITAEQVQSEAARADGFRPHLVWELDDHEHGIDLTPRLINNTRSRKGKVLKIHALLTAPPDCLTDADRRVLEAIRESDQRWTAYSETSLGPDPRVLGALIDHPRVRRAGPEGGPLRVTRGQPSIRTRSEGKATILELVPRGLAVHELIYSDPAPDELRLFVRDPKLTPIYELFTDAGELRIPPGGRKRLLDGLAKLATGTSLRIDGERALAGEQVPADPRIVMQLQWDGSTFVAEARVAPLGLAGPRFAPGEGPLEMVARIQDELRSCTRDFGEERRRFELMLEACPTLASQPEDEGRWDIHRLEDALASLQELDALGDTISLTWPQGRKLAPPQELRADALRVAVSSGKDWLELSVGLELDEGRVLSFEQLLAKRRGGGRFVELGDEQFLTLTGDLRRRLDALESLGPIKKTKLAASAVTLPLLEDIVGEAGELKTDERTRVRLDKLREIAGKTPRLPRGFQAELRDYQREGFNWMARLAEAGLGAVLADDMGLGKTVQTLALLGQRSKLGPALVVAPTSVVSNWSAEAERFAPRLRCQTLAGADDRAELFASLRAGDVLLCSYGLLVSEAEALAELHFATVVFDEAHALKNASSRRSKVAFSLSADFRLSLTGTPLENHLGELWSVFQTTIPGLLSTQKRFDERFTRPIAQGQRDRSRQLRAMIRPFVLRRTKAAVLDELPPRTEVTIRVTPGADERAFYEALRR